MAVLFVYVFTARVSYLALSGAQRVSGGWVCWSVYPAAWVKVRKDSAVSFNHGLNSWIRGLLSIRDFRHFHDWEQLNFHNDHRFPDYGPYYLMYQLRWPYYDWLELVQIQHGSWASCWPTFELFSFVPEFKNDKIPNSLYMSGGRGELFIYILHLFLSSKIAKPKLLCVQWEGKASCSAFQLLFLSDCGLDIGQYPHIRTGMRPGHYFSNSSRPVSLISQCISINVTAQMITTCLWPPDSSHVQNEKISNSLCLGGGVLTYSPTFVPQLKNDKIPNPLCLVGVGFSHLVICGNHLEPQFGGASLMLSLQCSYEQAPF